jgi:hypothetical protein
MTTSECANIAAMARMRLIIRSHLQDGGSLYYRGGCATRRKLLNAMEAQVAHKVAVSVECPKFKTRTAG